jgi:hypothetical protein
MLRGIEKIQTRLFRYAQDQIQGKSWFVSAKRKTVFVVQLSKIVKLKPQILHVRVFEHALFENL